MLPPRVAGSPKPNHTALLSKARPSASETPPAVKGATKLERHNKTAPTTSGARRPFCRGGPGVGGRTGTTARARCHACLNQRTTAEELGTAGTRGHGQEAHKGDRARSLLPRLCRETAGASPAPNLSQNLEISLKPRVLIFTRSELLFTQHFFPLSFFPRLSP